MNEKLNNPHDKFFKALLSDKSSAITFLQFCLPPEQLSLLDLDSIVLTNTNFISPELEESFSDIILQVGLKDKAEDCYISILLEHKSYKDPYVDFQVMYYLAQAYYRQIKNKEPLKLILPIVYYHGEEKWEMKPIDTLFDVNQELKKYLPSFDKIFIDLIAMPEEEIDKLANTFLHPVVQLQRNRFDLPKSAENFKRIIQSLSP